MLAIVFFIIMSIPLLGLGRSLRYFLILILIVVPFSLYSSSTSAGEHSIFYKFYGLIDTLSDPYNIRDLDRIPFPSHDIFIGPKRTRAYMLSSRPHKKPVRQRQIFSIYKQFHN